MRQVIAILIGCVVIITGLYFSMPDAFAESQSVMQPYVATPDDVAHAHELTQQFYAQPIPTAAMRMRAIKQDPPTLLGNGYTMQMVYPKSNLACVVTRDAFQRVISVDGCAVHRLGY
jgi:hypothetical protein